MTETIGPIYTDLARQANALKAELDTAIVERDEAQKQVVELTAQQTEYDKRVEQLSDHLEVAEAELERHKAGWMNALALLSDTKGQLTSLQGACEHLMRQHSPRLVPGDPLIEGLRRVLTPPSDT